MRCTGIGLACDTGARRADCGILSAVARGAQLRRALEKRFTKVRQNGSHITFRIGEHDTAIYAFHDNRDLGEKHLRMVAKDFGLTLEELKRLL
jgi:predicted RNA binding protein YcfA (HicA-like mRNA interferase family)